MLAMPTEQLAHVWAHADLERVGLVQLREHVHELVLARHVAARSRAELPDLLERAAAVHQADHSLGRGRVPPGPAARRVVHHVPRLAAIDLANDAQVRAQGRPQVGHTVPVRAQKGLGHSPPPSPSDQSLRRNQSTAW